MVKICSDSDSLENIFGEGNARDATWFYHHVGRVEKISSRGPDQQLQRRQRVYRQLGVQQALVLVQFKRSRKHSRYISVENIFLLDPSGH